MIENKNGPLPVPPERRALERLIVYTVTAAVCVLAIWKLFPLAWKYLSPFIIALPLAAMMNPLTVFLQKRCRLPRGLAFMIPVLMLFAVSLALLYWFGSFGIKQLLQLLNSAPGTLLEVVTSLRTALDNALNGLKGLTSEAEFGFIQSGADQAVSQITAWSTAVAARAVNFSVDLARSLPSAIIYLNFLVIAIVLISKSYEKIRDRFRGGSLGNPDTSTGQLTSSALGGLIGWTRMQFIYAMLSLIAGSVFWSLFGYRYAVLISVCAAILEFLPVVGNGTLYCPWALIALVLGDTRSAVLSIALYLALLTIRRFTEPKLLSTSIGVTPLISLVAMFAGMQAGGLVGMIGGPVVAPVFVTLWNSDFRRTVTGDVSVLRAYMQRRWGTVQSVPENRSAEPRNVPVPPKKETKPAPKPQPKRGKK